MEIRTNNVQYLEEDCEHGWAAVHVTFTDFGRYHGKNDIAIMPIEAIVGRGTLHMIVEHALQLLAVGYIAPYRVTECLFGLAMSALTLF